MDFDNPLKVVVHYLQNSRVVYLGYQDGFPMVNILVCMITHWTGPMESYD